MPSYTELLSGMKKLIFVLVFAVCFLSSCNDYPNQRKSQSDCNFSTLSDNKKESNSKYILIVRVIKSEFNNNVCQSDISITESIKGNPRNNKYKILSGIKKDECNNAAGTNYIIHSIDSKWDSKESDKIIINCNLSSLKIKN